MKFLALDFGAKRLGLALSDDNAQIALPHDTYTRRVNDNRGDIEHLLNVLRAHEVKALVLGIPSGSDQSEKTALQARNFAAKLQTRALEVGLKLEIHEQDERFSTALAARGMREGGASSRESGNIDAHAAAAFLQTFLDARFVDEAVRGNAALDTTEAPDANYRADSES